MDGKFRKRNDLFLLKEGWCQGGWSLQMMVGAEKLPVNSETAGRGCLGRV